MGQIEGEEVRVFGEYRRGSSFIGVELKTDMEWEPLNPDQLRLLVVAVYGSTTLCLPALRECQQKDDSSQ